MDRITSRLVYIYKDPIDWDHTYFWRVRDVYSDNSYGPWTIPSSFIIEEKKYEPNLGELFIEQSSNNNQLTLLGDLSGGLSLRSFVFDQGGKEIWNADVMLSYISEYGELFGSSYMNFPSNTGVKFNYDSEATKGYSSCVDTTEITLSNFRDILDGKSPDGTNLILDVDWDFDESGKKQYQLYQHLGGNSLASGPCPYALALG